MANRLIRRSAIDDGVRDEMEFHQQARAADLERVEGLCPREAARRARIEFGGMENYREEARAALGFRLAAELHADLVFAGRVLRKSPGFALACTGILALAIGANAAFFTLYSNVALRPLPIRAPERHVFLEGTGKRGERTGGWSPGEIAVLRDAARGEFEDLYAVTGLFQVRLLAPSQRNAMTVVVSADFFSALGGTPALGRLFAETEEREPVAVASDAGWRKMFPGAASPIGRQFRVRTTWFTIVGAMPPSFTGTQLATPDFWVPSGMITALREDMGERMAVSGHLRPEISPERAAAALTAVALRFQRPENDVVAAVRVRPRDTFLAEDADGLAGLAPVLFATFLLVLAIACANLANLFVARTAARSHEIGMRFSLGAGRWRIVRQLLTESILLALIGAAAGLWLAWIGVSRAHVWLFSLAADSGALMLPVTVDWRVFAYSGLLGLFAGGAFGLLPAWNATGIQRRRQGRLRKVLLSGQVAAGFVLPMLAGVLVRHLQRLDGAAAGFDTARVFDLQVERPAADLLERIRSHPAVAGVSAVQRVTAWGRLERNPVRAGEVSARIAHNIVDERFFETLGTPLTDGRGFHRSEAAAGARVAVVSQSAARTLWPGLSAIGRPLTMAVPGSGENGPEVTYQVIGVAPNSQSGWILEAADAPVVYLPGSVGQPTMGGALIRLNDISPAVLADLGEICARAPGGAGCDPKSIRDIGAMQRFPFQAAASIAGLLGLAALLLTAIGLYSVVSHSVEQRRREIGILVAIGARPLHVVRRVLGEAAMCLLVGLVVGLPFCLGLSALANSSVLGIRSFDLGAYLGVPALLAVIAAAACLIPVRRALGVQPMTALRQD